MPLTVFHVYRNTPLGRETLRQAADFARRTRGRLKLYVPEFERFLLYFPFQAVEIRLDRSYLFLPGSSERNRKAVLQKIGVRTETVTPTSQAASNLPNVQTDFDVLSLPRVMVERPGTLPGVGTGVRHLVKASHTPALVAPGRFHDWRNVVVLFGGSAFSVTALRWGETVAKLAGVPLQLLTRVDGKTSPAAYEAALAAQGLAAAKYRWDWFEDPAPEAVLDHIRRTALIVMGAYGHGRILARVFGSTTELVLRNTANLILLVGEHARPPA